MDSPPSLSTVSMKPADFYSRVHRPQREESSPPPPTTGKSGVRPYVESKSPRMRWTKNLHRYFLRAVEQLGGEERATPKMVFELMNVRGLKVTHVKSHLQMYRTQSMKPEKKILEMSGKHLPPAKSNNVCFYSGHVQETTLRSTVWEPVQLIEKGTEVTQQGLYTSDVSHINNFGLPRFNYCTVLKDFINSTKPTSTSISRPNIRPTITTQAEKEVMSQNVKERQELFQDQVNLTMMPGLMTAGVSTSRAAKNDVSLELTLG